MSTVLHDGVRTGPRLAALGLGSIGALHAAWGFGSHYPVRDRRELGELVAGAEDGRFPSRRDCLGVAALLFSASAFLLGFPRRAPRLARLGSRAVVLVLAVRGSAGLAGRTDLLVPTATSKRFRTLDRRIYSPLCLTLAALAAPAASNSGSQFRVLPRCAGRREARG